MHRARPRDASVTHAIQVDTLSTRPRNTASAALRFHNRAGTARSVLSKSIAALMVIFMFSPLLLGAVDEEPAAGAALSGGPFRPRIVLNDNKTNIQAVPVILATPEKELVAVWQDARSGNDDIYLTVSADNGTSFARNTRADDATSPSKQIEPAVAIMENGTIAVAWQDNRRGTFDYDIFFSMSYDGGATFTRSVRVDDSNLTVPSWQERPSIAVLPDNTIFICWTDDRTGKLRIRGAYSTNGGATFTASEEVAPGTGISGQNCASVVSNGNRLFVSFIDDLTGLPHPYLSVSTNGGRSFSSPTRLDRMDGSSAAQRELALAPMPDGGVAAVWADSRNGDWDIYAATASRTCAILIPDFRVDDDTSRSYQRNPAIAADQVGNLYVAWEDERSLLFAVRFAYAEAGIASFSASMEVAPPGKDDLQRKPSIVAIEPGQVFVTWQDDRDLTYDIYFSAGYIPGLFSLALAKGWNLVSIYLTGYEYNASTLGLMTGDMVVGWNSSSKAYDQTYIVGFSPPSRDFRIIENVGYWVYASASETLDLFGTVPTVTQRRSIEVPSGGGWAVIAFETTKRDMHASDVPGMFSVPRGMPMLCIYDPITQTYETYYDGLPSTDFQLVTGKAYWCWCTASGTLSYDP